MREARQALSLLLRIAAPPPHPEARVRCAVIAAHPDDETISAASVLMRHGPAAVFIATDGAPANPALRHSLSKLSRIQAASVRRDELRCALDVAGVGWDRVMPLSIPDQEAATLLPSLTRKLVDWMGRVRPAAIIGHAYEGGHPDHDAVAFAMQSALRLMPARMRPVRIEMASYHGRPGRLVMGELIDDVRPQAVARLDSGELERKAAMIRCHRSQAEVIGAFPLSPERFRLAPDYDFTQPPHPGTLYYESLGWMPGSEWRRRACMALEEVEWMGRR